MREMKYEILTSEERGPLFENLFSEEWNVEYLIVNKGIKNKEIKNKETLVLYAKSLNNLQTNEVNELINQIKGKFNKLMKNEDVEIIRIFVKVQK